MAEHSCIHLLPSERSLFVYGWYHNHSHFVRVWLCMQALVSVWEEVWLGLRGRCLKLFYSSLQQQKWVLWQVRPTPPTTIPYPPPSVQHITTHCRCSCCIPLLFFCFFCMSPSADIRQETEAWSKILCFCMALFSFIFCCCIRAMVCILSSWWGFCTVIMLSLLSGW